METHTNSCPACGERNVLGARYCVSCGGELDAQDQAANTARSQAQAPSSDTVRADTRDVVVRGLVAALKAIGVDAWKQSRRLDDLLNDSCAGHSKEVELLMAAIPQQIPDDIAVGSESEEREELLDRLTRRLERKANMDAAAADWVVRSWASALDALAIPARTTRAAVDAAGTPASEGVVQAKRPTGGIPRGVVLVATDGSGSCSSVSDAVRNAQAGDRVLLRPGVYSEREIVLVDKNIEISAETPGGQAIIEYVGTADPASVLLLQAQQAIVRNLVIRAPKGCMGIEVQSGASLIEGCRLSSQDAYALSICLGSSLFYVGKVVDGGVFGG